MNSRPDIFAGIDPGRDGALAILGYGDAPVAVPFDRQNYIWWLARVKAGAAQGVFCVVEHVNAMPGQGVTSCFSFGENFGWLQGVLDTLGIPYELVRPQKWKKEFSCTSDKNTSIEVAQRLFPGVDLRRTPQCHKPHDGKAEALLLAAYAKRHLGGDYA